MVHLLLATIPSRQVAVQNLLGSLATQTTPPDTVHLCLEGYGNQPSPAYPPSLHVTEYRTNQLAGPGSRWRVLPEIPAEAVLVVLDDDQYLTAPTVVETLAATVKSTGGAVSLCGFASGGYGGILPQGHPLFSVSAGVMAMPAAALSGFAETVSDIRSKLSFDPLGDQGDDEAIVSYHLWKKGIPAFATGELGIVTPDYTQAESQSRKRFDAKGDRSFFWQRDEIARVTGWPWTAVG